MTKVRYEYDQNWRISLIRTWPNTDNDEHYRVEFDRKWLNLIEFKEILKIHHNNENERLNMTKNIDNDKH